MIARGAETHESPQSNPDLASSSAYWKAKKRFGRLEGEVRRIQRLGPFEGEDGRVLSYQAAMAIFCWGE